MLRKKNNIMLRNVPNFFSVTVFIYLPKTKTKINIFIIIKFFFTEFRVGEALSYMEPYGPPQPS